MPDTIHVSFKVKTSTDQRGNLHGRKDLSNVGFFLTELQSWINARAKDQQFKILDFNWNQADKPQLPYEDKIND